MLGSTQVRQEYLNSSLYLSACSLNLELVQSLLKEGADPNYLQPASPFPLLHHLAMMNYNNIIKQQTEQSNKDKTSKILTKEEIQKVQIQIITLLVQHGAEIEARLLNKTPLHMVATYGNAAVLNHFIKLGANIEALTNYGETPLHIAAQNGNLECLEALLSHKANQEARTDLGNIPLYEAILFGHPKCISVLRSAHPNKNSDAYKKTLESEKTLAAAHKYAAANPNKPSISVASNRENKDIPSYKVNWKPYSFASGLVTAGACFYLGLSFSTLFTAAFFVASVIAFLVKIRNYYLEMASNYYPDTTVVSKVSNKGEQEALKIGLQANTWSSFLWSYTKWQAIRHPIAATAGMKACLDNKSEITKEIAKLPGIC